MGISGQVLGCRAAIGSGGAEGQGSGEAEGQGSGGEVKSEK